MVAFLSRISAIIIVASTSTVFLHFHSCPLGMACTYLFWSKVVQYNFLLLFKTRCTILRCLEASTMSNLMRLLTLSGVLVSNGTPAQPSLKMCLCCRIADLGYVVLNMMAYQFPSFVGCYLFDSPLAAKTSTNRFL